MGIEEAAFLLVKEMEQTQSNEFGITIGDRNYRLRLHDALPKKVPSAEYSIAEALCCRKCGEEFRAKPEGNPAEYMRTKFGWTPEGLQVWCVRHDCNVLHLGLHGDPHDANTAPSDEKKEGN